jgi:hypothetical protein
LNDEKIISQPQLELVKMKCPVSRRAFSSLQAFSTTLRTKAELRQKTGTISGL